MYLSKRISQDISDIMIDANIADATKRDILIYCFEYLLDQIFYITSFLILGIVLGQLGVALLFLITFYSLRSFGGGFHTTTERACTILSTTVYLFVILSAPIIAEQHSLLWFIGYILSILLIIKLAPVDCPNKPLDTLQKKKMKKKCIFCCTILSLLWGIFYILNLRLYYGTISICAILVAISMMLGFVLNKLRYIHNNIL